MDKTVQEANKAVVLEALAAEVTLAAYRVALQTRTQGTWLDLELDLWRTLGDTVKTWGRDLSAPTAGQGECSVQGRERPCRGSTEDEAARGGRGVELASVARPRPAG